MTRFSQYSQARLKMAPDASGFISERSNAVAQALYKSLGFEYVGVRKRYYEDNGEDALLFCCQRLPDTDPDFEEAETAREEK